MNTLNKSEEEKAYATKAMADRLEVAGRELQARDKIRQELKRQEEEKAELDRQAAAIAEYKRQYDANAKARFERANPDLIRDRQALEEQTDESLEVERKIEREEKTKEEDDSEEAILARLRAKRMKELKAKQQRRKKGYGDYREIVEAEFLSEACSAENVIVHFYHREFVRCKIMDKHLERISRAHDTVKILKLNAEKAPFFVNKLKVKVLPTVIMFKNGVTVDRLTGFERVLGDDKCRTRAVEYRLIDGGIMDDEAAHGTYPDDELTDEDDSDLEDTR